MDQPIQFRPWSKEQREFWINQYYFTRGQPVVVRQLFCKNYGVNYRDMEEKCPSVGKIKQWVAFHEQDQEAGSLREMDEERTRESSK